MLPTDALRIAIISDVHAVDDLNGNVGNSNVLLSDKGSAKRNPMEALIELVKRENLKADLLVCPGDLCDKGDPEGLTWTWNKLQELSILLGAEETLATTGNHDVDSRLAHKKVDTYGALLDLQPPFPLADENRANEFFARGITVHETPKARVVLLDSCFLHRERKRKQLEHGFLTPRVLERVADIASKPAQYEGVQNILVCHHQPLRWTEFGPRKKSKGEMRGGEALVRILERGAAGPWILLHGHCHVPAIDYLGQTSGGPVRFSAGSVGAALPANAASVATTPHWSGEIFVRNQFYVLEVDAPGAVAGIGTPGRFRAWDWLETPPLPGQEASLQWRPASRESIIPGEGGFGFRAPGIDLANWITRLGKRDLTWQDLLREEKRLEHLAPCDMNTFVMVLRKRGHGVFQDPNGRIEEVSLK